MIRSIAFVAGLVACHHEPAPKSATPPPEPAATTGSAQTEGPEITDLRAFKDRMCACKDLACANAVDQEIDAWSYAPHSATPTTKDETQIAFKLTADTETCARHARHSSPDPDRQ